MNILALNPDDADLSEAIRQIKEWMDRFPYSTTNTSRIATDERHAYMNEFIRSRVVSKAEQARAEASYAENIRAGYALSILAA